jgi:L-ascorbate metabolism protein UlaG (beta-lactamase superfamily)
MKIKKLGHCCLVIENKGKRIMTDPGSYTVSEQELERNIDLVVITHEHADHIHVDSLKNVLTNNLNAIVVTNTGVGKLLDEAGIKYQKLEDGNNGDFAGVHLEAHGDQHAEIYEDFGMVQNTGYLFDEKLFYPGDAFINPGKPIDILALPVLAPWLKIKESIDYAIALAPRICFPVHDWNIKSAAFLSKIPPTFLERNNIIYKIPEIGKEEEF